MKKRIVIAGATGFIGRWIIKNFKNEYDIIALSRKEVSTNQVLPMLRVFFLNLAHPLF